MWQNQSKYNQQRDKSRFGQCDMRSDPTGGTWDFFFKFLRILTRLHTFSLKKKKDIKWVIQNILFTKFDSVCGPCDAELDHKQIRTADQSIKKKKKSWFCTFVLFTRSRNTKLCVQVTMVTITDRMLNTLTTPFTSDTSTTASVWLWGRNSCKVGA